jgi:hypothetical protein
MPLDRSTRRTLAAWDDQVFERIRWEAHASPTTPLLAQVDNRVLRHYHEALSRVLALSVDTLPEGALEEAGVSGEARARLVERLGALKEELTVNPARPHPYRITWYLPFVFWDDDPKLTEEERRWAPRQAMGPDGLNGFLNDLRRALAPLDRALRDAEKAWSAPLSVHINTLLRLPQVERMGWPKVPCSLWPEAEVLARSLDLRDWLKAGFIPLEIGAPSMEILGLLGELMTAGLREMGETFNTPWRWVGLPQRRAAAMRQTLDRHFLIWSHRLITWSEGGKGQAQFLIEYRDQQTPLLRGEVTVTNREARSMNFHQIQTSLVAPEDALRLLAPWWSPAAAHITGQWSLLQTQVNLRS